MIASGFKSLIQLCQPQNIRIQRLSRNIYFQYSMESAKPRVGFVIDIDGTLTLNKKPLPGARQTLQLFQQKNIPFLLLTNNVAKSERIKAKEVNELLQLQQPLTEKQVVLNYTPIKHKFQSFKEEIVLIVGREVRLEEVLPLPDMERYITVPEYLALFPQTAPLSPPRSPEDISQSIQAVKKRLKDIDTADKHSLKIGGIVILTTPNCWQQSIQVIIDLLSTSEGKVSQGNFYTYPHKHIPVMTCYNDMFHMPHGHNLPRLLMKPFNQSLKTVHKLVYGHDLKIDIYGKPHPNSFNFAKEQLEQISGPINKIVMIGDNVEADIIGPLELGWDTILVKTGVNKHDHPHSTINSENIFDGVKMYLDNL